MKSMDLLRLPQLNLPNDMKTGHRAIDVVLVQLDRQLIGTPAVRRLTLNEVREHLLESHRAHQAAGLDQASAASRAVREFGAPSELASNQRAARLNLWKRVGFSTGLTFATIMLVFESLAGITSEFGAANAIVSFLFHGVFFGTLMGAWLALASVPAMPQARTAIEHGHYRVETPTRSRRTFTIGLMVVMLGLSALFALGLFGFGPMASLWPGGNVLMFLLASGNAIGAASSGWQKLDVSPAGLAYSNLLRREQIEWAAIESVQSRFNPLFHLLPMMGCPHRIIWRDRNSRQRRLLVVLNHEMTHADRLQADLERVAEASSAESTGLTR